jgi:hypothetical protein
LIPHVDGKNKDPHECDHREDIPKHEAPVMALDLLLDLALEIALEVG